MTLKSDIYLPSGKSASPTNKVFFGILKYLLTDYSDYYKFIVPLDRNYFPQF